MIGTGNNDTLTIVNGLVGIGTMSPDETLSVNGSADKPGGGSWDVFSDARLKTVEGGFDAGLEAILKLTPVRYRYKEQNGMGIKDTREHVGFVAQEVEKVIPEAVSRNGRGYLLVNNDPILWAMLNAIKEQQALIREQRDQIRAQHAQIEKLQSLEGRMAALQAKLDRLELEAGTATLEANNQNTK